MITNLLNTLILSASISLGVPSNFNNEIKPNRANENNVDFQSNFTYQRSENRTLTIQTTPILSGITNPVVGQKVNQYTMNTSEIQGTMYIASQYTEMTPSDPYTNLRAREKANTLKVIGKTDIKYENPNVPDLPDYYWKNLPVQARMYFIKIKTNQNLSSTKLNIVETRQHVYGSSYQDNTKLLITTNNLEEYFTENSYQNYNYYKNNNLLDMYNYIKEEKIKYTGQEYNKIYIPVWDNDESSTITYELEYQINNNNTYLYMLFYTELQTQGTEGVIEQRYEEQTTTNINTTGTKLNAVIDYDVVDIGGVAFTILGMPFTFISTAFNLTLFPNTPYSVNISTLFLSVFAVIVFVFIVKMILGAISNK